MSPIVHGMFAWLFAFLILRRTYDRRLAVIAGVAMDIDGVFILFDLELYQEYHHTFTHSLLFAILLSLTTAVLAKDRIFAPLAALGSSSLHIIGDAVGTNWPVYPLYPFSHQGFSVSPALSNLLIYSIIGPGAFILCCILTGVIMWRYDASPVEFFSLKWDKRFVHSFTYFFRKRCSYCGRRAFGDCSECKKTICSDHIGNLIGFRCSSCKGAK